VKGVSSFDLPFVMSTAAGIPAIPGSTMLIHRAKDAFYKGENNLLRFFILQFIFFYPAVSY